MSRLLLHGCDTQACNQAGHTPLDLAVPKSSTARLLEEEAGARSYLQQQRPCSAGSQDLPLSSLEQQRPCRAAW